MVRGNVEVGNVVAGVLGAFDHRLVDAVLDNHGSKRCADYKRLSNNHMPPCGGRAVRANADLDAMRVHRAIVAALYVIFTSPYQLHRSATKLFGDCRRLALYMVIDHSPSAKAPTRVFRMKDDLFGLELKRLGDRHMVHRLEL